MSVAEAFMGKGVQLVAVPVPILANHERMLTVSPRWSTPRLLATAVAQWEVEREAWLLDGQGACVAVVRHEKAEPWSATPTLEARLDERVWRVFAARDLQDTEISGEAGPLSLEDACLRLLRFC